MFILDWLKRDKYFIIVIFASLIFLFVYSWLYSGQQAKFTSPDETANYYFIKLFTEKNQLRTYEPLNEIADGNIRPRSIGFFNGYTVPGSFLGIILIYGIIAKIFGSWIVLYLTPLFSIVGVLFFYLLIKEIFGKKIAFISSLLLFVLPPFWYYNSRGMFHNVLFVDLLIVGLYFLIKAVFKSATSEKRPVFANATAGRHATSLNILIAGFFIGLALITRTSEITWISIMLLVLFVINWRKIGWRNTIIFLGIIVLLFIPIFYLNNLLYNSPSAFTYSKESIDTTSLETISQTLFLKFRQIILPFGINFNQICQSAYQYIIIIFPWFFILFVFSFIWFFKKIILIWLNKIFPEIKINYRLEYKQKTYLWLYGFMALWLITYYGSYEFYEYIDKTKIILGSSYLRYWLPIYIFSLPFVALTILRIKYFFQSKILRYIISPAIILLFVFFSINVVLLNPLQGIVKLKSYIKNNIEKKEIIIKKTEPDSVIIAGFADKIFFPERKVIVNLPNDNNKMNDILVKLKDKVSVYYFFNPLDENSQKNIEDIKNLGIVLNQVQIFTKDNEVLYRLQ